MTWALGVLGAAVVIRVVMRVLRGPARKPAPTYVVFEVRRKR